LEIPFYAHTTRLPFVGVTENDKDEGKGRDKSASMRALKIIDAHENAPTEEEGIKAILDTIKQFRAEATASAEEKTKAIELQRKTGFIHDMKSMLPNVTSRAITIAANIVDYIAKEKGLSWKLSADGRTWRRRWSILSVTPKSPSSSLLRSLRPWE
jgi:hypothetical protein